MACSAATETLGPEDRARLHCLQALFHDWTAGDPFLLRQIQQSIEEGLREEHLEPTFSAFTAAAKRLRASSPETSSGSRAFVAIDFTGRTWDPLFARQEIVQQLKRHAGMQHLFLLIRGLRTGLFPAAVRRTRAREAAYQEAAAWVTELAREWTTPSTQLHLLLI